MRTLGKRLSTLVSRIPAAEEGFQKLQEVLKGIEIPLTAAELMAKPSKEKDQGKLKLGQKGGEIEGPR